MILCFMTCYFHIINFNITYTFHILVQMENTFEDGIIYKYQILL